MCVSTVGPGSPLDTPRGGSDDSIHCRWRPSFWDNVIMGGTAGSFVSCRRKFSTTSIMSAAAQPWAPRLSRHMTVFSCVLSFRLFLPLTRSFYHSQFIFIHSYPLFFIPASSPYTNLFVLLFAHISRCPHMLNEVWKQVVFTVFQNMATVLILEWTFWATCKTIAIFQDMCNKFPLRATDDFTYVYPASYHIKEKKNKLRKWFRPF